MLLDLDHTENRGGIKNEPRHPLPAPKPSDGKLSPAERKLIERLNDIRIRYQFAVDVDGDGWLDISKVLQQVGRLYLGRGNRGIAVIDFKASESTTSSGQAVEAIRIEGGKVDIRGDAIRIEGGKVEVIRKAPRP